MKPREPCGPSPWQPPPVSQGPRRPFTACAVLSHWPQERPWWEARALWPRPGGLEHLGCFLLLLPADVAQQNPPGRLDGCGSLGLRNGLAEGSGRVDWPLGSPGTPAWLAALPGLCHAPPGWAGCGRTCGMCGLEPTSITTLGGLPSLEVSDWQRAQTCGWQDWKQRWSDVVLAPLPVLAHILEQHLLGAALANDEASPRSLDDGGSLAEAGQGPAAHGSHARQPGYDGSLVPHPGWYGVPGSHVRTPG